MVSGLCAGRYAQGADRPLSQTSYTLYPLHPVFDLALSSRLSALDAMRKALIVLCPRLPTPYPLPPFFDLALGSDLDSFLSGLIALHPFFHSALCPLRPALCSLICEDKP